MGDYMSFDYTLSPSDFVKIFAALPDDLKETCVIRINGEFYNVVENKRGASND